MNKSIEKLVIVLLILTAGVGTYYSILRDPGMGYVAILLFMLLFMILHHFRKNPRRKLFYRVLTLLSIATVFNIINEFLWIQQAYWIYTLELIMIFAYLLMLSEVFHLTKIKIAFNIYSIMALFIVFINFLVIQKMVLLLEQFDLGWNHMLFGFFFTITKMLILSFGLIYFFLSVHKSKFIPYLIGALGMFFLSDLVDTLNYLFFFDKVMTAGMFLRTGFWMLGILLFYIYCTQIPQSKVES